MTVILGPPTVVLYGNGFGDVTPGIIPDYATQAGVLPQVPVITIGGTAAAVHDQDGAPRATRTDQAGDRPRA